MNLRTATQSHFWVAIWVAFYLKYDEMVRNGMVELKVSNGLIFDSVGVSYPFNFFQYNLSLKQVVLGYKQTPLIWLCSCNIWASGGEPPQVMSNILSCGQTFSWAKCAIAGWPHA